MCLRPFFIACPQFFSTEIIGGGEFARRKLLCRCQRLGGKKSLQRVSAHIPRIAKGRLGARAVGGGVPAAIDHRNICNTGLETIERAVTGRAVQTVEEMLQFGIGGTKVRAVGANETIVVVGGLAGVPGNHEPLLYRRRFDRA